MGRDGRPLCQEEAGEHLQCWLHRDPGGAHPDAEQRASAQAEVHRDQGSPSSSVPADPAGGQIRRGAAGAGQEGDHDAPHPARLSALH